MKIHLTVLLFLFIQILLNTFIAITYRTLALFIIHILLTILTLVFYLIVHLRNPGKLSIQQQHELQKANRIDNHFSPISDLRINQEIQTKNNGQAECQQQVKIQENQQAIKMIDFSKRLCRLCKIQQPLRTKHCYDCNQCIATFDHHCPWIANCIGEKNRSLFLIYLIFQILQVCAGLIICFQSASHLNRFKNQQLVLGTFLSLIFAGLSGLLIFHVYLMMVNLTTWQFAKWEKVWYFKGRERNLGSPFNRSILSNMKQYWEITFNMETKSWTFYESRI